MELIHIAIQPTLEGICHLDPDFFVLVATGSKGRGKGNKLNLIYHPVGLLFHFHLVAVNTKNELTKPISVFFRAILQIDQLFLDKFLERVIQIRMVNSALNGPTGIECCLHTVEDLARHL